MGLKAFLLANKDLFAWTAADMLGTNSDFCCHRLSYDPQFRPIAQRNRRINLEKQKIVEDQVSELLKARFIREIQYATWLANVVLVKKSSGKWRMCINYTDLNKNFPKDPFPLPNIDKLVDSSSGFRVLLFLDAYSSYN